MLVKSWKGRIPWSMKSDKCSVQLSCSLVSNSLGPHGLQHTRLPCPSPASRAYSNSCPLSWWWHPIISSSVVPTFSCLQSAFSVSSFTFIKRLFSSSSLSAIRVVSRVGHDWVTSLSLFTFTHWRRKWQPTPVFLPGEFQGQGSMVGCHLWGRTESDMTEATYHQQHTIFLWLMLHINIGNLFDF